MTNNTYFGMSKLIEHTFDELTKELLTLCSIPSIFTKELIEYYLKQTNKFQSEHIANIMNNFLSQPFVIKRKIGSKFSNIEIFLIHDALKGNVLSSTDIVRYAYILIRYYNNISDYGINKLKYAYETDRLLCEIITGNNYGWCQSVQEAIENYNIEECKKLISLYKNYLNMATKCEIQEKLLLEYYELVYKYLIKSSDDSLEYGIKKLLDLVEENATFINKWKAYLYNFLGIVYYNTDSFVKALYSFEKALYICKESNTTSENVYGSLYVNIVTACISLKKFEQAKKYIALIQTNIHTYDQELRINAYKVLGLFKHCIFDLNGAIYDYYNAKHLLVRKQRILKNRKHKKLGITVKPLYCPVEQSIYDSIGDIFAHQGNYKKAIELYRCALKSQILSQNSCGIAWSKYNIARIECLLGNLESSFSFFNQCLNEFRKINQQQNCAYVYGEQSYTYQYFGDTKLSINSLEKSIGIFLDYNMNSQAILYFNHLGRLYQSQGFLSISDTIFKRCICYFEKQNNSENIGWIYNNLARNYMYIKEYDLAAHFFNKAKNTFQKTKNLRGLVYVLNNIGELYIKLARFNEAKSLLKVSLKYKRQMGDQHAICYTLRELGELYIKQGNLNSAKKCLDEAIFICDKYCFKMLLGEIYISFAKLYGLTNNETNETLYYEMAANIYKSQNFISRLINCYNLQLNTNKYQNNNKLYLMKKLEIQLIQIKHIKHTQIIEEQLNDVFKKLKKEIR